MKDFGRYGSVGAALGVLAMTFVACALVQPGTPDANQQAVSVGQDVADLSCTALAVKAPADVQAQVRDGLAKASTVLAANSITTAALLEAMDAVKDEGWRKIAQAGVRITLRRLSGGTVPADIAKDSPAAVGASAFVLACQDVLGVRA